MDLVLVIFHLLIFILIIVAFAVWYMILKGKNQRSEEEPLSIFNVRLGRIEKRLEEIRKKIGFIRL
ncbi:MAG: hypothetical protein U9R21_04115 [Candidatus Thermoplasmatota archaeon]|nr:hypothetical protein [Candidatus Thermoplasmatota archaeon]